MKFYDCATAPSPRRVRVFMAEKNIQIETIQVDLGSGEQFSDEFKAINPLMEVPFLQLDDGSSISQVNAICRYLEEIYPDNPLYGRTPIERALVESANNRVTMNGFAAGAEALRNSAPGMKNRAMPGPYNYSQIPELATRGLERIDNCFSDLDSHFESSHYMVEDYFSVADISALVFIDFAKWVKKRIPENHTNLARWYAEVSQRPSAKA
ncbi:MAG: glutathione S-transferase family protein [Porticoccaceae bacterium]|nr:glutathione S-transferase family protein [Porticoccaceae bacterium]MBT4163395.1 glutathione S-transferase family protein [Porticoccaceae bacterium]MBT4210675.1 glutathione S-transferase family protein [Porticoccaceae bacterium]MBT4590441.1 glutathione S-transferase family protein [Porticoccaceae bacterium]MBT5003964.1 glutathione S-transferase family protein [Porticoccaceae bacterium]